MIEEFKKIVNNRAGLNADKTITHEKQYSALIEKLGVHSEEIINERICEYENASYIQGFSDAVKLMCFLP